jgi:hypothetical protein
MTVGFAFSLFEGRRRKLLLSFLSIMAKDLWRGRGTYFFALGKTPPITSS